MKQIDISTKTYPNKFALVDDEDYERVNRYKWHYSKRGYAIGYVRGKHVKMHRFILRLRSKKLVDHINHNKVDNRRKNIRVCTTRDNLRNAKPYGNKEYKGTHKYMIKNGYKYRSYIYVDYKQIGLGVYDTEEEAAKAYNKAAARLFGNFALLNVIN